MKMQFSPGERFELPSGQLVFAHIRLVPDASGDIDDPNQPERSTAADYVYEVGLDGSLSTTPFREFRPGVDEIPALAPTALTVDDLRSIGHESGDEAESQ